MALRRFMHPRNKYREGADFRKLFELYPNFREHIKIDLAGKLRFNFKNEESLRVLTKTLLKHDYELDVEIPNAKLVPAMPLRLNYILWIEDLLEYGKLSDAGGVHGIDIGTGAVCIYPLLCAKTYGWRMTGTDISETSVLAAQGNIEKNNLGHLIKVIHVKHKQSMLTEASMESQCYSFTMCNPPFFDDETKKKVKRLPPRNAATGNASELLVEGGERQFVTRLLDESLSLENRVKIYTTMLGHKSSCAFFRSELKRRNILNATWTEFCQGHTKRWGLAWTFLSKQVVDLTNAPVIRTRNESSSIKKAKDRPSETVFPLTKKFASLDELIALLKQWLRELKIETKELELQDNDFDGWTCRLKASADTWSHARRKRRMASQQDVPAKQPRLENTESEKVYDCAFSKENLVGNNSSASRPSEPFLECSLTIGELENAEVDDDDDDDNDADEDVGDGLVKMCIIFESGQGGKHALETFRQYLINKLNIREYLLSRSKGKRPRRKKRRGKKCGGTDQSAELNVPTNS